ncbi:GNAT family N-acetyltransferase [Deinococcus psychrotolerans]|uniref:GNAT family N-acetyltransferase n=1 Tax=Deinococcus psychrotolerans TaxID=2489213 RepID=A0A3G8Y8R8_9DEIO|nr:GNAT family N-acetyltransferase [Deinococcus psychrotolerans]AZI41575.1 GNAT family N-acetyltransferase [Deinococcus psychrotolerans]
MTTLLSNPSIFDPPTATPAERLAIARLMADCFVFAYPEDPPLVLEQEAAGLSFVTPGEKTEHVVVWEGGQVLAWGMLEYSLEQNLHLARARLLVHPEVRRRGLGRRVAEHLISQARQAGRTTLTFVTTDRAPAGQPFAEELGAAPAITDRRSQLNLAAVSTELLDAWLSRPAGEAYQLHLWQTYPEAYLERMAQMVMVMNTAPRGELDYDDWKITPETLRTWEQQIHEVGEVRWTAVIEDTQSGELVGYSEIYWTPQRASAVDQGATAVRPSERGRGLGKWLKAALTRQILQQCSGAQFIRTSNANENAAMLGINVAMGFEPFSEQTEWQLHLI